MPFLPRPGAARRLSLAVLALTMAASTWALGTAQAADPAKPSTLPTVVPTVVPPTTSATPTTGPSQTTTTTPTTEPTLTPAPGYRPPEGPLFSNPFGNRAQKNVAANQIKKAIEKAKPHSVIRIAVYSFNRQDLANALLDACDRKVAVQIVVNDNIITPQITQVRKRFGSGINPKWKDACHPRDKAKKPKPYRNPSFLVVCHWSCRYKNHIGNQHIKMYLFEHTGRARNVVMFGSNNMATYAADTHWNDLYTLNEVPLMFSNWSTIFAQLAQDKKLRQPYVVFDEAPYLTEFGPKAKARGKKDPVAQRLAQVNCKAKDIYGNRIKTRLRITMYAWVGSRGIDLAQRVAKLAREGCEVKAILSSPGAYVVSTLRSAGIEMRSADLNLDRNVDTGFNETPWEKFTHEKWLTVEGGYGDAVGRWVWTGSENWANKSFWNDEMTVKIPFGRAWRQYNKHFNFVWKNHTRRMGRQYARELYRFWSRQHELQALGRETLLD